MLRFADRIKETSTTTGTGAFTLAGAATNYISFATGVGNGNPCYYAIVHQTLGEWEVGVGPASSGTLTRAKVLASSNSNAAVNFSAGTKDVYVTFPAEAALVAEMPSLCEGRLTFTSANPVPTADQTAITTLYFTPYQGTKLSLYDTTTQAQRWKTYNFSELSIAVPASVYRIYDVFVYDNTGTLTLELNAWDSGGQTTGSITGASNASPVVLTTTNSLSVGNLVGVNGTVTNTAPNGKIWYVSAQSGSTLTLEGSVGNGATASGGTWYKIPTARTDAIVLQDGIYVKSANKTRRYLGTFMTGATSGQTEDSKNRRLLWNNYNRRLRFLQALPSAASWTYTTAAYRASNANTDIGVEQVWALTGLQEDPATALVYTQDSPNTLGIHAAGGLGINRTTVNSTSIFGNPGPAAGNVVADTTPYRGYLPLGFSYLQRLEYAQATGTTTFFGNNTPNLQSGMAAEVMA